MEKETIIVRRAEERDAEALTHLYIYTWKETYRHLVRPDQWPSLDFTVRKQKFLRRIKDPNVKVWVAEIGGEVVGMISAEPNRYYPDPDYRVCIETLYINKGFTGRGLGAFLFKTLFYDLKKAGVKKVMLWCIKGNLPSIDFYKKQGGTLIEEVKIPEAFLGQDCVVFTWDLSA